MGLKVRREADEALRIAPLGAEDHARPIEVDEHRDVVVAAAPAGLIHAQAADLAEVFRGTGISLASVSTSASNNSVKPLPGLAQGTSTCRTPQVSHLILGKRAVSTVSYCQKLRWRQRLGSMS